MDLTIEDLYEYRRNPDTERGKAIRAELDIRMPWMPKNLRGVTKARFLEHKSAVQISMEMYVARETVFRWTKALDEWLRETNEHSETGE